MATSASSQTAAGYSHTFTMPSAVEGDLLVLVVAISTGYDELDTPSDWTEERIAGTDDVALYVYTRQAGVSGAGGTSVTTSSSDEIFTSAVGFNFGQNATVDKFAANDSGSSSSGVGHGSYTGSIPADSVLCSAACWESTATLSSWPSDHPNNRELEEQEDCNLAAALSATRSTATNPDYSISSGVDWSAVGFLVKFTGATAVDLTANGISVVPRVDDPPVASEQDLQSTGIKTKARLGTPAVAVEVELTANGLSVSPRLDDPGTSAASSLSANGLSTKGRVDGPSVAAESQLTANGMSVEPRVTEPGGSTVADLVADGVTIAPSFGTPATSAKSSLAGTGLHVRPRLGESGTSSETDLVADGISIQPRTDQASAGAVSSLAANGITTKGRLDDSPDTSSESDLQANGIKVPAGSGMPGGGSDTALVARGLTVPTKPSPDTPASNYEYTMEISASAEAITQPLYETPETNVSKGCGCCEDPCIPPTVTCTLNGSYLDYEIENGQIAEYTVTCYSSVTQDDIELTDGSASGSIPLAPGCSACVTVRNECGEDSCCLSCFFPECEIYLTTDEYGVTAHWKGDVGIVDGGPVEIVSVRLNGVEVADGETSPGKAEGTTFFYYGPGVPEKLTLEVENSCGAVATCWVLTRCCWRVNELNVTFEDLAATYERNCTWKTNLTYFDDGVIREATGVHTIRITGLNNANGTWTVPFLGRQPVNGQTCWHPYLLMLGVRARVTTIYHEEWDTSWINPDGCSINGTDTEAYVEGELALRFGHARDDIPVLTLFVDDAEQLWRANPTDPSCVVDCAGLGEPIGSGWCRGSAATGYEEGLTTFPLAENYSYGSCDEPVQYWAGITRSILLNATGTTGGPTAPATLKYSNCFTEKPDCETDGRGPIFGQTPHECGCDNEPNPPFNFNWDPKLEWCRLGYFKVTVDYD